MGWSHILIEASCCYEVSDGSLPENCIYGAQKISFNCLHFDSTNGRYCPYLLFGKPRSSKVLTDDRGVVIDFDLFEMYDVSEEEYLKLEKKWIKENRFTSFDDTNISEKD